MTVKRAFRRADVYPFLGLGLAWGIALTPGFAGAQSQTADWIGDPDVADAHYGHTVSTAGDVDGDGYDDVIVGAKNYSNGESSEGAAYVYYGSETGLSATPDFFFEGNARMMNLGESVSTAGDVNGDGYDDVIIGAPLYTKYAVAGDLYREGAAFVYYGSPAGLSAIPDCTLTGTQNTCRFGGSVSKAGDVNGDGYDDVIVGADAFTNGEGYEGAAFIFHGSEFGLNTAPAWSVEGNQVDCRYGTCVSNAGDVDDDGFDDVIVGAIRYDSGEDGEGKAFLYYGSASGANTVPGWTAEGNQVTAEFGRSVSAAGDINGDDYDDVIVGCYSFDISELNDGKAFVYYGSADGLSSSAGWIAQGGLARSQFGWSVSTAGDCNNDGFDDVIIGANQDYYDQASEGIAYVFYGSETGLSSRDDWNQEGNQAGAQFGWSVSTAGDVNGDGSSDVIIGATYYDKDEYNEGAVFVYHGTGGGEYIGRNFGDFNDSNCTDLDDFLILLDNWHGLYEPVGPPDIELNDFLALLDNWQTGSNCP